MLMVSRSFCSPFPSLSSLIDWACGSTTSSSSRWPMSAPSMKKSRRRNMMSIMGLKLGETSSWMSVRARRLMLPAQPGGSTDFAFLGLEHEGARDDVVDLGVQAQADVGDLVLQEEVHGEEDDGDEEAHGG